MSTDKASVDASKLREGDVVLVECAVVLYDRDEWNAQRDSDLFDLPDQFSRTLNLRARRIHSIEPRPIAVGDRVTSPMIREACRVEAIRDHEVALSREDFTGLVIAPLSTLTREDQSNG